MKRATRIVLALAVALCLSPVFAQSAYPTAEAAADAFVAAVEQRDQAALQKVLGAQWRDYIPLEGVEPPAHRRHRHCRIRGHLFARQQLLPRRTALYVDFALNYGNPRARFFRADEKHRTDNLHRHVLRLDMKMSLALLRRFDKDSAASQVNPQPIVRTLQRQLRTGPHFDT